MEKKELVLRASIFAVLKLIDKGSSGFLHKLEDGTSLYIDYEDVVNFLTDLINKNDMGDENEKND